jgi:hypothetical protein
VYIVKTQLDSGRWALDLWASTEPDNLVEVVGEYKTLRAVEKKIKELKKKGHVPIWEAEE